MPALLLFWVLSFEGDGDVPTFLASGGRGIPV